MSHRELRNFVEYLQILGFQRQVSIENFRSANFPLVAEILQWLCSRFDSNIEVSLKIGNELERVMFIRTVAQILAVKGNIRLNTKKLYQADGRAVQEMLRVVLLLYQAQQSLHLSLDEGLKESNSPEELNESSIRDKLSKFDKLRRMASTLTTKGAKLYDDLAREARFREQRHFVVNRPVNLSEVEEGIREAIKSVMEHTEAVNSKIESISADEKALESKIEKKREDLERYRKRLEALKSVRPAFMDEFELLEKELAAVYDTYVLKHRCLVFLEQQLEEVEKAELEHTKKREASIREVISSAHEKSLFEEDKYNGETKRSSIDEDDEEEEVSDIDKDAFALRKASIASIGSRRVINSLTATRASRGSASGLMGVAASEIGDMDSLDSDIDLGGDASDLDSAEESDLIDVANNSRSNLVSYATSAAVSSGDDGRANRTGHRSGRVTVAPSLPIEDDRAIKNDSDDDF